MIDQRVSASLHCEDRSGLTLEVTGPKYQQPTQYTITVNDRASQPVSIVLTLTEMYMLLSILSSALPREAE